MLDWPVDELPVRFLRDGFAETEPDIVERTPMDGGHVKRRLKAYPLPGSLAGPLYYTQAQFDALIGFYRAAADSGAPFTMPHPVGGQTITAAFAALPTYQPAAAPGKGRVPVRLHKFGVLPARAKPPRTALAWPAGLPQYYSAAEFTARTPDNVLASEAAGGAFQSRLRGAAGPSPLEGWMAMTDAQYDDYCVFYRDTARGVLPFAFPAPSGGGTAPVQFAAPPARRPFGRQYWRVTVNLEKR